MHDLHGLRKIAADKALAEYDFGVNRLEDSTSWNTEDDQHDEWTCVLTVEGIIIPYFCGFIVRFKAGTAEVTEAFEGKPHSLQGEEAGDWSFDPEHQKPRTP
jgi:hypothetical protein